MNRLRSITLLILFSQPALSQTGPPPDAPPPHHIIGGTITHAVEHPFVAWVDGNGWFCTGSHIAEQWVLTAAHCVVGHDGEVEPIRYITVDREYPVEEVFVHPDYYYAGAGFKNDVALLKLVSPQPDRTEFVQVAPHLNEGPTVSSQVYGRVLGYGRKENDEWSDELRYADVSVLSPELCRDRYEISSEGEIVYNGVLCSERAHEKGTNSGDSGGPLVIRQEDGNWLQVGITSMQADARRSKLGIYTRVSSISGWIHRIMGSTASLGDSTAKRFHVFPQIADGDGWQSFLLVTNVSQSASQCTFSLHGMDIDRFAEISGITAAGSTATFDLEESGDYLVWGSKNELSVATGYATLDCSAPVVAQVLYALNQLGVTAGMATVFSSQVATVFQFPVLGQGALAFAIANDADSDASCDFVLESPDRLNLGQETLAVTSKSKVAKFLSEVIQIPAGFTGGSATVSCDQQVSIIGLQIDGTVFTTLPPAILSITPEPTSDWRQLRKIEADKRAMEAFEPRESLGPFNDSVDYGHAEIDPEKARKTWPK